MAAPFTTIIVALALISCGKVREKAHDVAEKIEATAKMESAHEQHDSEETASAEYHCEPNALPVVMAMDIEGKKRLVYCENGKLQVLDMIPHKRRGSSKTEKNASHDKGHAPTKAENKPAKDNFWCHKVKNTDRFVCTPR